jgi:hypothetical protein
MHPERIIVKECHSSEIFDVIQAMSHCLKRFEHKGFNLKLHFTLPSVLNLKSIFYFRLATIVK